MRHIRQSTGSYSIRSRGRMFTQGGSSPPPPPAAANGINEQDGGILLDEDGTTLTEES